MSRQFVKASDQYASRVSSAPLQFTTGLTVAGWVYHDTVPGGSAYQHYVIKASGATWASPFAVWAIRLENTFNTSNAPRLYGWVNNGADTTRTAIGATTLSAGQWYHVAMTYDLTTVVVYLNGVSDGTKTVSEALASSTGDVIFSRITGLSGFGMDGRMAQWAVWNTAKSAAYILQLAKGMFPSKDADGVGYWQLRGEASPEPEAWNGLDLTLSNTPTQAAGAPEINAAALTQNREPDRRPNKVLAY